jgi:16S rRNA (cytosine1402-N4)-methyltransferase
METKHVPVLLQETIEALNLEAGELFLDGTFGGGGHTRAVLEKYPNVRVIGIDQDPLVNPKSQIPNPNFEFRKGNFRDMDKLLEGIQPDAILLDIGISSDQLEASGRGFTFLRDEPLDMRMSQAGPTAADILNSWDEHAIELILRGFGEEKYSRKIARAIVERREIKPFETTTDLVEAVESAVPKNYERGRINPSTRTFQALRIAVNDELQALEEGLENAFEILKPQGRLAVITFHSLEDRIVKNFFRDKAKEERGKLINKKPITASEEEVENNPRSRSAKLRTIEKII